MVKGCVRWLEGPLVTRVSALLCTVARLPAYLALLPARLPAYLPCWASITRPHIPAGVMEGGQWLRAREQRVLPRG